MRSLESLNINRFLVGISIILFGAFLISTVFFRYSEIRPTGTIYAEVYLSLIVMGLSIMYLIDWISPKFFFTKKP